jgi:hypothetical protein
MILSGGGGSNSEEYVSRAVSSTTNPTWTARGANPGFLPERPATNRQSRGTAVPRSLMMIDDNVDGVRLRL